MRLILKVIVVLLLMLSQSAFSAEKGMTVKGIRHASYADFTRIVFEVEAAASYVLMRSDDRSSATLSSYEGPFVLRTPLPVVRDSVVTGLELREVSGRTFVVIRLDGSAGEIKDFVLRRPDRIVIDIAKRAAPIKALPKGQPKVIVLDPGHGGRDMGIVTSRGQEKTLTLDLAFAIRKILQKNPRLEVVLTRNKDRAITLDKRAAASNAAGADLLVSLHAAPGAAARVFIEELFDEPGIREIQPVSGDFLGYEARSKKQEVLWGRQQAAHARESGILGRMLARLLVEQDNAEPFQTSLAPLMAVDAAAVLIETGVDMDRAHVAEAIAGGIEQYVGEN